MVSIGSLISKSISFKDNSNLFKSEQDKSEIINEASNQSNSLSTFQYKTNFETVSNNKIFLNMNSILNHSILLHNHIVKKKSDELLDYYLNNIMESILGVDNDNWYEHVDLFNYLN